MRRTIGMSVISVILLAIAPNLEDAKGCVWRRGCHTSKPIHISRPMSRINAIALLLVTTPSRNL
jgi:hypothetical protein